MLQKIKNIHQVKSYFSEFADKFDLVEFGEISSNDDIGRYKGLTFSPDSSDSNFHHGTINDYDLSLFTRKSNHLIWGSHSLRKQWTILALHLKQSGYPNMIIDTKKHQKEFYQTIFLRYPTLCQANSILTTLNIGSTVYFDLYTSAQSIGVVSNLLDDMILQRIYTEYSSNDVQIDDDILYIFRQGQPASYHQLKLMLAEALWLAETIELKNAYGDKRVRFQ